MDIFSGDIENRLIDYKSKPLLFSIIENSTCTVQGSLSNVIHNESDLTDLTVNDQIVKIDSNFIHLKFELYNNELKGRKSNRGRKKKVKPIKTRKYQGDGSSFNSQISFTVLGDVVRNKPINPDKHSVKAIVITKNDIIQELFTKEYKIKVFRNGQFTIPGVLTEDLSDVRPPLLVLCDYFEKMFNDVQIINLFSVMRNYKFHLIDGMIDVKKLQVYCVEHFQHLLNTKFSDIEEFIINPIFLNLDMSPNTIGWVEFINEYNDVNNMKLELSIKKLKNILKESKSTKNLFVDFDTVCEKIMDIPLSAIYIKIKKFISMIQELYFINFNDYVIKNLIKFSIKSHLVKLEKFLFKSKDNLLSHIKYDPEKYPGFLIKVKTPNDVKHDKRTTIKIFPSGKINIDGSNNKTEAEYIYYWLNNLFHNNPDFTYNANHIYNNSDSEFSSDSEID